MQRCTTVFGYLYVYVNVGALQQMDYTPGCSLPGCTIQCRLAFSKLTNCTRLKITTPSVHTVDYFLETRKVQQLGKLVMFIIPSKCGQISDKMCLKVVWHRVSKSPNSHPLPFGYNTNKSTLSWSVGRLMSMTVPSDNLGKSSARFRPKIIVSILRGTEELGSVGDCAYHD